MNAQEFSLGLVAAVALVACGPSGPGSGATPGATCHELVDVEGCDSEVRELGGSCSFVCGSDNPDPIVCEDGVLPDGNCKPLGQNTTCGGLSGAVFCCGENP